MSTLNIALAIEDGIKTLAKQGTAEQQAHYLAEQKITGRQGRSQDCVVAEFLKQLHPELAELDANMRIAVDSRTVGVITHFSDQFGGMTGWDYKELVKIDGEMTDLIRGFDRGKYPELVKGQNIVRDAPTMFGAMSILAA